MPVSSVSEAEAHVTDSAGAGAPPAHNTNPWALAFRRLRRKRAAVASIFLLLAIVGASLLAPMYAHDIAHVDPFKNNVTGTTVVDGRSVALLQAGGGQLHLGEVPIGPTWDPRHYFLGADEQGRDVAARMLYGGRTSLEIGVASAAICCLVATLLGLLAGYFGGFLDGVLSRTMDGIWAFPVYLFAISLATVLLTAPNGFVLGPIHIVASSLSLPIMIVALVYIPYVYRPVRAQVLSIREKEFVEAAIAQGASDLRVLLWDVLPNVVSVVIVLFPLMIATNILTESALSFLSIGVQPPNASWGTVIADGEGLLYTRPWVTIAPTALIVLTVLSLNVLGDGFRDALDPRAKLRVDG